MTELVSPSHADFADRIGQVFAVGGLVPDATCDVTLIDCSPLHSAGGYTSFSVLFRGAPGVPSAQGVFTFSAPGFGPAEIFTVPVRQSEHGVDYEVIYNQMEG